MRFLITFVSFICLALPSMKASHVIGAEISYQQIVAYEYEITLILYGDCAGSSFPSLPTAIPRIEVYKNNIGYGFLDLSLTGPGVEVTPVCPAEAGNTTCVNSFGTVPGIMKFVYKGSINLGGPALEWKFFFNSSLGGNTAAGRTNAITNISPNSRMGLEATLNNMNGPNNSSLFTTIPTPFFCVNNAQEFNQGAADPDGDQLSFSLVAGIDVDNTGSIVGPVNYIFPYTYLNPLATAPGNFSFNPSNGQMSFIPNLVQTSLVVNKVTEMRGGQVVGTCMREMNLIVLNNCNNQSPTASIPTSNVGTFTSARVLTVCNAVNPLQFLLNASDPDNQNVYVTVTGLPSGATASITGNNTPNPQITINWNLPQPIMPGIYNFYVNCEDDGCPMTSKQTIAYSVVIVQPITPLTFLVSPETCVPGMDGSIQVSTSSSNGGLSYSLDATNYQSANLFNNLAGGTYTITVKDASGCTRNEVSMVASQTKPLISATFVSESCKPGKDASITISSSSVNGAIVSYSANGLIQNNGSFNNLMNGIYTIMVVDAVGCTKTSIVQLNPAIKPTFDSVQIKNITCFGLMDGQIKTRVTPLSTNYTYLLLPDGLTNNTGQFINLDDKTYTIIVSDNKGCSDTTLASITEPIQLSITNLEIKDASCDKDNATIRIKTNSSNSLIYTVRPATFINTSGYFENIAPGTYTVSVRDSNFCSIDTIINITLLPNLFRSIENHKDLTCNGWGFEGEAEVIVSGGIPPYSYLWSDPNLSTSNKITGLYYGWYFVDIADAEGCEIKDTVYIKPGPCCDSIYLPNAFSPNGDGINDTWKLVSSSGLEIRQFAVFNRWGQKVWDTKDQRNHWDGRQHNVLAPVGTYFYLLNYRCLTDGKIYTRKGDVTILH